MEKARVLVRWWLAINFAFVGVTHFTNADLFVGIMPPYLPAHLELVWISGVFEILGAVGLLVPFSRRFAGFGLLALLVAVFPANLHMALNEVYLPVDWLPQNQIGLWLRLPFQLVFAAAIWFSMGPHRTANTGPNATV
ncbi:MAG: putative membrane protein [Bradymonadia bacterium]|jgi:uncharacterized membrane protein